MTSTDDSLLHLLFQVIHTDQPTNLVGVEEPDHGTGHIVRNTQDFR